MLDCIVSLTTWKGRIYNNEFLKVLFRLCNQKTQFKYKVVLSLSEEEFTNKELDLPQELLLFNELKNFEILWSYKNTRALKNYFPVKNKYKHLPIIVIGDDTIYSENLVEIMMQEHLKEPMTALGNKLEYLNTKPIPIPVLWQVRLFPPNCMFNLPEEYFQTYFKNLDNDRFYGICLLLQKTNCKALNNNELIVNGNYFSQDNSLYNEYIKKENDFILMYNKFITEHNELLTLI